MGEALLELLAELVLIGVQGLGIGESKLDAGE
jgi:hypothetical protein